MQFLHNIYRQNVYDFNWLQIVTDYIAYICIMCIYIRVCACTCVRVYARVRTCMCILYHVRVCMYDIYKFYQYINFCKLLH